MLEGRSVLEANSFVRGVSVADIMLAPRTRDIDRDRTRHRNLPVFNERSDPSLRAAEGGDCVSILTRGRDRPGGALDLEGLVAYLAATSPRPTRHRGFVGWINAHGQELPVQGAPIPQPHWHSRTPTRVTRFQPSQYVTGTQLGCGTVMA